MGTDNIGRDMWSRAVRHARRLSTAGRRQDSQPLGPIRPTTERDGVQGRAANGLTGRARAWCTSARLKVSFSSTTTGGSLPPVASPLDRAVQIQLARHALDGRTRPVDVALRLAARGSSAPGNDAGRSAWNTNARAARRPRVDGLA